MPKIQGNVALKSGVPLVIENTVGKKGLIDFSKAVSVVYQDGDLLWKVPEGKQVVASGTGIYVTGTIVVVWNGERV